MKLLARFVLAFSCDPRKFGRAFVAWPGYLRDLWRYIWLRRVAAYEQFPVAVTQLHPLLLDKRENAGALGVYFHQDLYVARKIFRQKPAKHLDIGSRVDGFVAHLLVFMEVQIVDVRPLVGIDGLSCHQADARRLSMIEDNSVESLSCLHALEHFGLGRYGDEVDPAAWEAALGEMLRVLAPHGRLYLSVPLGVERVEFNSQRVFGLSTILEKLQEMQIESVCLMNRHGLVKSITRSEIQESGNLSACDGCIGIFEVINPAQR